MSLLRTKIEVIKHKDQRYDTVGDWYWDNDILHIRISRMGNDDYHHLVAIHEYVEAILCRAAGIKEEEVSEFDKKYEADREEGDFSEPGDCIRAPYYKEHQYATLVEKEMAKRMRVDWEEYEKAIQALVY